MSAHRSIRRRLLAMLISTILLVWMVVIVLVYRAAEHEVEQVFDADLARSTRILQALLLHEVEEEHEINVQVRDVVEELGADGLAAHPRLAAILDGYMEQEHVEQLEMAESAAAVGHKYGNGLAFIARYADGTVMLRDGSAPDIPPAADGYADLPLGGESWRVYSLTHAPTGFLVQVGERLAFREELVRYITRDTLMPALLALPLLAVLIWAVVGRALAPLQRVAGEVSMRAPDALEPIDDHDSPHEIHSLLNALNSLFGRVESAIQRERQFTADAAHELRTPLAGLKTHLQVARAQASDASVRHSLDKALDGVDRATHSVEQLLLLARADSEQTKALLNTPVNLRDIAVWAVSTLSQQALDRDVDLGVDVPAALSVQGDATALQMMLRNLVDNAIRYTPKGGTVTVVTGTGREGPWIEVLDDGVGVAVEEREKIFNRFHRGAGEQANGAVGIGLGLSIVQRIAALHGARVRVADGLGGAGLGVRVTFPNNAVS